MLTGRTRRTPRPRRIIAPTLAFAFALTLTFGSPAQAADDPSVKPAVGAPAGVEDTSVKPAPKPAATEERKVFRRRGAKVQWWEETLPIPETTRPPFDPGERLEFVVRVLGKQAGRGAAVVQRKTRRRGRKAILLEAEVRSEGVLDKAYPVRDEYKSFLDPGSITPIAAQMDMDENREPKLTVKVDFGGRSIGRVRGARFQDGKRRKKVDFRTPLRALDPLSSVYHLRSRDYEEGQQFSLFVYNGTRVYRMDIEVKGREKVYTELGMKEGWKLAAKITRADGSRPKWHERMTIWISTAAHRAPLKASFDMGIGTVDIVLAGAKGLKGVPPKS